MKRYHKHIFSLVFVCALSLCMCAMGIASDRKGFIVATHNSEREVQAADQQISDRMVAYAPSQPIEQQEVAMSDYAAQQEIERLRRVITLRQKEIDVLKDSLERQKKLNESLKTQVTYAQYGVGENMYEVVEGDNLWKIAKRKTVYNNPQRWIKLYNANMDRIKNPNVIFPGQLFRVPE